MYRLISVDEGTALIQPPEIGMNIKTTYHRDGTVTYWSVHNQVWVPRADSVPAKELAAMSSDEREKVQRHLGK